MTAETLKDILDWSANLHRELAAIYREASARANDERSKMLLTYLAEHEMELGAMLDRYERDETLLKIDTWFRDYLDKKPFMKDLRETLEMPSLDNNAIMDATVEAHQKLIELYGDLSKSVGIENFKTLFDSLATMESNELKRIVLTGERWSDM